MGILGNRDIRNKALLLAIEVDKDEESKDEEAGYAVPAEGSSSTVIGDEHATNDGAATTSETMVDALQDTLGRGPQMLWCIMGYVGAGSRPHRRMGDALHQLEGQHHPRIGQIRDVQEAQNIAN